MPLVSITRLRVRSPLFLPQFFFYAIRSVSQAKRADGNLATSLLRDRNRVFWTATLWSSEVAMKQFMVSGAHGKAMRKLLHWCDEASLVHWTQDQPELPCWPDAHHRMQSEGRASKVLHPSAAHLAFRFPPPQVGPGAETRLK